MRLVTTFYNLEIPTKPRTLTPGKEEAGHLPDPDKARLPWRGGTGLCLRVSEEVQGERVGCV